MTPATQPKIDAPRLPLQRPKTAYAGPRLMPAYSYPQHGRRSVSLSTLRPLILIGGVVLMSLLATDWLAGLSLVVLWGAWKYLSREPGPPVIAAAFTHQWLQVTVAIFYAAVTGRRVIQMDTSDYRPMILIGLGSVVAMFAGFYLTAGWRARTRATTSAFQLPVKFSTIATAYAVSIALAGALLSFAWSHPELTQVILVMALVRYVLLYLLVRRLATPTMRWGWILLVLLAEVALGFGGFFADFRQPIAIVSIALLGVVNRRRARTWVMLGFLGVLAIGAGVVWTALKPILRRQYDYSQSDTERLRSVAEVAGVSMAKSGDAWLFHADTTVSRVWAIYYPALAVARVPSVVPHENGALLAFVIRHLLSPRILFPDKPALPSDSDKVRKYSGVWVAGREVKTSYAFGYAAESYVDFGVPLMFFPIFVLGMLLGATYSVLMRSIEHAELRTAAIVVVFWSVMSMFETSWVMMVGRGLTQIVVLGAAAVAVDRMVLRRRRKTAPARRAYGGGNAAASIGMSIRV